MSYASEVLADAPAVYYRMDEASGNPQDSSGHARHVTATSGGAGFTYSEPGAIASDPTSKSIKFQADAFSTPDVGLDFADVFTIECWVKANSLAAQAFLLTKQDNAYELALNTDGTLTLNKSAVGDVVTSTLALTVDGAFHHIVVSRNAATATVLYIDAVDRSGTVSATTFADNANTLRLGGLTDTLAPLNGWLDEIALYSTALSAARVSAHYAAAQTPTASVAWLRA